MQNDMVTAGKKEPQVGFPSSLLLILTKTLQEVLFGNWFHLGKNNTSLYTSASVVKSDHEFLVPTLSQCNNKDGTKVETC